MCLIGDAWPLSGSSPHRQQMGRYHGNLLSPLALRPSCPARSSGQHSFARDLGELSLEELFPRDVAPRESGCHLGAFSEGACCFARNRELHDSLLAAPRREVRLCKVCEGPDLWASYIGDTPGRQLERELHKAAGDLTCVYGLEEPPFGDRRDEGHAVQCPHHREDELVELGGSEDGTRNRRALDEPLGVQLLPVIR